MIKKNLRALTTAVMIGLSSMMSVGQANACMVFGPPDPTFWSEHATSLVDATVYDVDRKPLTKRGDADPTLEYADTWVLKLRVHRTLRGEPLNFREVATRISNTTIVDEKYILDLLGERKEFAVLDVPYTKPPHFITQVLELGHPPNIAGFHARDLNGKGLDEIWEGLCAELPIFELGTFGD